MATSIVVMSEEEVHVIVEEEFPMSRGEYWEFKERLESLIEEYRI